ncbi:hypothetical protein PG593_05185 [Riemerella anatipestifer]|nr:hypothetical protein [Riemerella anatipestifer]
MKKIESVIESCDECRYSKEFQEVGGNTDFVLICTRLDETEEDFDELYHKSFMLARAINKIKGHIGVDIPSNCPLEDYKTNKKRND